MFGFDVSILGFSEMIDNLKSDKPSMEGDSSKE